MVTVCLQALGKYVFETSFRSRISCSNPALGVANDGSRPKSALPNPPSWLQNSTLAKATPPPPLESEQVSVPTRPSASITCTVGQMSTRVDFANIQDFHRLGMQILQQAHLASMCMATPAATPPVNLQMMQSQLLSASSIMPVSNVSMLNMSNNMMVPNSGSMQPMIQSTSSSAFQVATVPRPVSNPMLQHWPPAKDTSLPKEGWFLLSDLWVFLPQNYQYDIAEIAQNSNSSLMQGCFEVPWKQNPTIFVLVEFQHLLIYDSEGPLQILDNTEIKDPAPPSQRNAIMLRFRMVATRFASRMRSISELKVREYEQGKEVDLKVVQLTAACLTSVVENPDSLAVDASYWQQLAEIIAAAGCLQYVHRVRLVKISDQVTGLIADAHLNQAVIDADRFLPESELYYVAHNTTFSSCVSICKQGAFLPSKWNQDEVTWVPPLTFCARGHLTMEGVALRVLFAFFPGLRPGKWTTQNQSPEELTRISLRHTFGTF